MGESEVVQWKVMEEEYCSISITYNSQLNFSWWNHIPTEFKWSLVFDFKDVAYLTLH